VAEFYFLPNILRFAARSIWLVAFCYWICCGCSSKGNVAEIWQIGNKAFDVRVDAYSEKGVGFVRGAYYVFTAKPHDTSKWSEVMTFRHDDPVPIPREQIRFVTDKIGFIFMGWMYAVTTDAGHDWSVWDARSDLANWQCCNYGLINDVNLQPDGTGKMILNPIEGRRGEVPKLCTRDFGRHWTNKCD
jgi:hypothetical protein